MEYLGVDDHIHLERIKITHAGVVYDAIVQNRKFLRRWLPFVEQTRTIDDTRQYIRMLITPPEKEKNEVFTIWVRGEFAGLVGFKEKDPVNHRVEIGYWLTETMQGKGIMSRSVGKMIDYGFRNLRFNRIQIKVADGNLPSAAIPARLGFSFEGTEREGEFHTDRYFNLKVFSLLKKEWLEKLMHP